MRKTRLSRGKLREKLEGLYLRYNHKRFVDPDPLFFLYDYPEVKDREIAGLLAASLAYGRVSMIMATVKAVLDKMGPDLHEFVFRTDRKTLDRLFRGFRYRFASQAHLTALILGIREMLNRHGSIESCFLAAGREGDGEKDVDVLRGLAGIYNTVNYRDSAGHLLADPGKASACKRSHLYLRWMVRRDGVDPGGWASVSPGCLVIPVDTHMYKIGRLLGFTKRKSADKTCALEITRGFSRLVPEDPVRYDFALTRFGIRREFDVTDLKSYLYAEDE